MARAYPTRIVRNVKGGQDIQVRVTIPNTRRPMSPFNLPRSANDRGVFEARIPASFGRRAASQQSVMAAEVLAQRAFANSVKALTGAIRMAAILDGADSLLATVGKSPATGYFWETYTDGGNYQAPKPYIRPFPNFRKVNRGDFHFSQGFHTWQEYIPQAVLLTNGVFGSHDVVFTGPGADPDTNTGHNYGGIYGVSITPQTGADQLTILSNNNWAMWHARFPLPNYNGWGQAANFHYHPGHTQGDPLRAYAQATGWAVPGVRITEEFPPYGDQTPFTVRAEPSGEGWGRAVENDYPVVAPRTFDSMGHARVPPGKGEKEKKSKLTKAGKLIGDVLGGFSEFADVLDAAWLALPANLRSQSFYKGERKYPSWKKRWNDVYQHYDKVDLSKFLVNFAKGQAQDEVIGRLNSKTRKLAGRPGDPMIDRLGWIMKGVRP